MSNNDLERKVEAALIAGARALGGDTRKLKWIGQTGAPDRLVLIPRYNVHVFVELKRPKGGVVSARQISEQKLLRTAGCDVRLISSIEEVDEFFVEIVRHGGLH